MAIESSWDQRDQILLKIWFGVFGADVSSKSNLWSKCWGTVTWIPRDSNPFSNHKSAINLISRFVSQIQTPLYFLIAVFPDYADHLLR